MCTCKHRRTFYIHALIRAYHYLSIRVIDQKKATTNKIWVPIQSRISEIFITQKREMFIVRHNLCGVSKIHIKGGDYGISMIEPIEGPRGEASSHTVPEPPPPFGACCSRASLMQLDSG